MNALRLVLAFLLCAEVAGAAPWRGVAEGRGGQPAVELELGYPDGFVSTLSSPVVLRIRTGNRGFDGYISFRLGTSNRMTIDTPIATRVKLGAHSEQVFATYARSARFGTGVQYALANREVMVDWRTPSLDLIATRSLGLPPWQWPRPLVLPSAMSTDAQWYGGFTNVVAPIDDWFALPVAVREAIFRSAVPVVFFGVPSRIPDLAPVDRALLPVEFRAEPGTLEVPWPYTEKTRPVPISWRAKPQTRIAGSPQLPYLVWNGIATFAAGEEPIRTAVPSFRTFLIRNANTPGAFRRQPNVREILRDYRPLIAMIVLVPLPFIGWILMRRRPRLLIVISIAAVGIATMLLRDSLSASAGRHEASIRRVRAAGVVEHIVAVRQAGPSPLGGVKSEGESIAWAINDLDAIEVRTPKTLAGFGTMVSSNRGWQSRTAIRKWRERSTPATIRSRQSAPGALTVDYDADVPVDYVAATWTCGGKRCGGIARVGSQKRGSITVNDGTDAFSCLYCRFEATNAVYESYFPGTTAIDLVTMERDNKDSLISFIELPLAGTETAYSIAASLEPRGTMLTGAFALLSAPGRGANATVSVNGLGPAKHTITLSGPAGTLAVEGNPEFSIEFGELRRIAPRGGIVTIALEPQAMSPAQRYTARLKVGRTGS